MLIREWKCKCPADTVTDFINYLEETGVKDTQSIDGCCGYKIMRREVPPDIEITFMSFWETFEHMKVYAGDDLYQAVLYPEDKLYRITSETEVKIDEIVSESTSTCQLGAENQVAGNL